ncbi:MAG: hypothetical protein GQ529_08000 [Methyloprofundus sp.]|nr:hypothetical protein [Methyloprofundus sp.]
MKNNFEIIASSSRFIRLQRNVDQESTANESGAVVWHVDTQHGRLE